MPGQVSQALSSPVAGKPGLPKGFVASALDAMTAPVVERARMSQGELWREFLRHVLTTAPMAIGRAPMPNTVGIPMHSGAANLPPAWANTRQGMGQTPWGMGTEPVQGMAPWVVQRPNVPPTANMNHPRFTTFPGGLP